MKRHLKRTIPKYGPHVIRAIYNTFFSRAQWILIDNRQSRRTAWKRGCNLASLPWMREGGGTSGCAVRLDCVDLRSRLTNTPKISGIWFSCGDERDEVRLYNRNSELLALVSLRYENISKLISSLGRIFEAHGQVPDHSCSPKLADLTVHPRYFWICDNTVLSRQKGVFRVNCIDCLDRTNVVQVSRRATLPANSMSIILFSLRLPDMSCIGNWVHSHSSICHRPNDQR